MTKPLTEAEKERNKIIRRHKRMTSEQLAEEMSDTFRVSCDIRAEVIRRVRHQIKNNSEWYDVYHWYIEKGETEVKSWASICVQAYGYDYTTKYTLDTGYNKYETTIFDSKGWYTE